MLTRLVSVAAAAVIALTFSGCGKSAGSNGEAASPAAGQESTDTGGASSDLDDFNEAMTQTASGNESYHFLMSTNTAGFKMKGEGDFGPGPVMQMTLGTPLGKTKMIVIGKQAYMRMPTLGNSWFKMPIDLANQQQTGSNPNAYFELFKKSGAVTLVGSEDVDGVSAKHYHVVIPAAELKKSGVVDKGAADILKGDLIYDIWVDGDKHPVKLSNQLEVSGTKTTLVMKFSNFGEPVSVQAPPASQVKDFPKP